MLTNTFIIAGCVLAALAFLFAVTRASAAHARKESNDFTGAVVAVIGTTYAVILAFMLANVWNIAQQAAANEEQEANALVNVWRIAGELQSPSASQIQALCVTYADSAINKEWPAMARSETLPPETGEMINQLWHLAGQIQSRTGTSSIAEYQLMEELRLLTEFRRLRIMQSREGLPGILWAILITGGIITVAASCWFGVPNFKFHILQVAVLTFLISLVLVAIADIDRPYQGPVRVRPEGFIFSLKTFGSHGNQ